MTELWLKKKRMMILFLSFSAENYFLRLPDWVRVKTRFSLAGSSSKYFADEFTFLITENRHQQRIILHLMLDHLINC